MKKQEIEVIINTPDEEILQEMMAKAIAQVIIGKINSITIKDKKLVYEQILKINETIEN